MNANEARAITIKHYPERVTIRAEELVTSLHKSIARSASCGYYAITVRCSLNPADIPLRDKYQQIVFKMPKHVTLACDKLEQEGYVVSAREHTLSGPFSTCVDIDISWAPTDGN